MTVNLDIKTPRWALPMLKPGLRFIGIFGGRGSGKSHALAEMLVERCVMGETRALCLREVQGSLKESVKALIDIKIRALGVQHLFTSLEGEIRHKTNGSVILFKGLRDSVASDSVKSFEGFDIFWIEEAQSISANSLKILLPTIRKKGSQFWATWNPCNETDPIEFLRTDPPPNSCIIEVNYSDNPWFADTELKQMMEYDKGRDIDSYNHIWLGQYEQSSEARVFKNWKVKEFDAPAGTMFRFGADFGYSADPTVLVRTYIEGRKLFIDYEVVSNHCEIEDLPLLFGQIEDSETYPIIADSSRPETISHIKRHGFPRIFPSTKGAGSIKEGIAWLQSYDIIVHPRCKTTITELTQYSFVKDKLSGLLTSRLKDKDNHVIDALRYACEAVRKNQKKKKEKIVVVPTVNYW